MVTAGSFRWALALFSFAAVACSTAAKDDKKQNSSQPALADDALIGSCQAKDNSFCDEYHNRASLKDEARTVELTMTKGACESELKNGTWREGKACEPKGEIGHCVVDKHDSLKRVGYSFKGDEEMTGGACKDLMGGKWESGLADGALLGRCVVGTTCTELHNNKQLDAEGRGRAVNNEKESCERLEGTFEPGKACEAATAKTKCTTKGDFRLTTYRFDTGASKEQIKDMKELCEIGGTDATFETLGK
jgi:hypothetical protein